jgi:hypothetical protein
MSIARTLALIIICAPALAGCTGYSYMRDSSSFAFMLGEPIEPAMPTCDEGKSLVRASEGGVKGQLIADTSSRSGVDEKILYYQNVAYTCE